MTGSPERPFRPSASRRRTGAARVAFVVVTVAFAWPAGWIPVSPSGASIAPGLVVDRERPELRIVARVAADRGFLEQLVCLQGTREHESLLSISVPPSLVHAGLLALGLEPGRPGRWWLADGTLQVDPPEGPVVEPFVRRIRGGRTDEFPLRRWTVSADGSSFDSPIVFAGSEIKPNPPSLARFRGPGEHYVADLTGSVVGLVTFGDELLAPRFVHADRAEVEPPTYQARTEAMPAPGTAVTLILRPTRTGG